MQFYAGEGQAPVELIFAGDKAYVGYKGEWKTVDDPLSGIAPGGDFLSYLDAVTGVEEAEPAHTAAGQFRRYTFSLDSGRYAELQRQRTQQALAGRLPQGVEIQASEALLAMSGQGEVWVDARGLPARQILDIDMPEASAEYAAKLHIVVDFSRFGDPAPGIAAPQPVGPNGALVLPASQSPSSALPSSDSVLNPPPFHRKGLFALQSLISDLRPLASLLLAVPFLALALVVMLQRRRRVVYAAVAVSMTVMMVVQPLAHAAEFARFTSFSAQPTSMEQALSELGIAPTSNSASETPAYAPAMDSKSTADLTDCRSLYADEGSSPQGDDDGDLLSNEMEWCIGTDYADVDSDGDGITDTVELEGFTWNDQRWTSDPLADDSNHDGISDGNEWSPILTSANYTGTDTYTDKDGDGVPNLWDDDNDGDGVPDDQDISPFVVTGYRSSLDLAVTNHNTGTAVYVDLQVQPEDASHLRYSLTTLDWPAGDGDGQITNTNGTSDMTLMPVLEISSNISPTLAGEYTILSNEVSTDTARKFNLWVPLQPVETAGGIFAFSSRIAFTSAEADLGINLTQGRILWLATINGSVAASYYESQFRVTGLNVTEYKDVQVGLFGTSAPETSSDGSTPDEDKVMFTLASAGLGGTYLSYLNPDLDQIATDFANANAQSPFTETWGIDPSVMHVTVTDYSSRDEALADTTQSKTVQFLNSNYTECTVGATEQVTPTLATAYQETNGFVDISNPMMTSENDDPDVTSAQPMTFTVPLADRDIYTLRRVQLSSYTCQPDMNAGASWQDLSAGDVMLEVYRRYPAQAQEEWMGMVQQLFLAYQSGVSALVAVNGEPLTAAATTAPDGSFGGLVDTGTTSLPEHVRKVYELDALYLAVDTKGLAAAVRDWQQSITTNVVLSDVNNGIIAIKLLRKLTKYILAKPIVLLVKNRYINSQVNEYIDNEVALNLDQLFFNEQVVATKWINNSGVIQVEINIQGENEFFQIDRDITEWFELDEAELASVISSTENSIRNWSTAVGVITSVLAIGYAWLTYSFEAKSLRGAQRDLALVTSWVTTYLVVIQLVFTLLLTLFNSVLVALTFSGIGIVIQVVVAAILYLVVSIVSGDWNPLHTFDYLTKWWVDDIAKFKMLAAIPSKGVNTAPLNMATNPNSSTTSGVLPNAWFQISTTISTTVGITNSGSSSDVAGSWAFSRWITRTEQPFYLKSYSIVNSPGLYGTADSGGHYTLGGDPSSLNCTSVDATGKKVCETDVVLKFQPGTAGVNTEVPFYNSLEANLKYYICKPFEGCGTNTNYSYSGDADSGLDTVESDFTFDVLPATLAELVAWDAPEWDSKTQTYTLHSGFNPDLDNDQLDASQETTLGTSVALWDTDGDKLSDGWEADNMGIGVSAVLSDTDGDGLSDKAELALGTSVAVADSDGDGLLDGEEVCHLDDNNDVAGGWLVSQAGNYWTCSDPLYADYDGDGLVDSQEKAAGLSPYAPNVGPSFLLTANPSVLYNQGQVTVIGAGDPLTVTMRLNNTAGVSINHP